MSNKTNNILNLQCQRSYPEAFDCRLDKEVCAYFSLHEYVIFQQQGGNKYLCPICGTDIEKGLYFSS